MADILIDVEVKGNQKVVAAVSSTKSLESNVKALSDAMTKGSLSQRQYYKGISQLAESSGKSEKQLRDYATALRRVEKESKAAKASQDRERESVKAYTQARREATAANQRYDAELKQKAKSEEEAARVTQQAAQRQNELRMRFQEGYATFARARAQMRDLREALRNNIITTEQYREAVRRLREEQQRQSAQGQGNIRSQNNLGIAVQQTGYQVGDFFVQVQSGTNALVAFGQQATQLVGVLPLIHQQLGISAMRAIALSTGFGIAIPIVTAIGAAFMRTSGLGKTLQETMGELEKASSDLHESFAFLEREDLGQTFGFLAESVIEASEAMKTLRAQNELKELESTLKDIGALSEAGLFDNFVQGLISIGTFGMNIKTPEMLDEEKFRELGLNMSKATFDSYISGMAYLARSGDRTSVVSNFNEMMKEIAESGAELPSATFDILNQLYSSMVAVAESNAKFNKETEVSLRTQISHQQQIATIQDQVNAARKELRDTYNTEERSLQQQIALNRMKLQFGKDSLAVENFIAQQARENYRLSQLEKGIKGNLLNDLMRQYDTNVQITGELNASTDSAKNLADALKEAGDAMASLVGMGSNLDVKIAGMAAQVQAFKEGTNAVVAGAAASERAKAAQARDEALAGGNIPTGMVNQIYQDTIDKIDTLADLTSQRDTLRTGTRGSSSGSRGGGGGGVNPIEQAEEYLQKLQREADFKRTLIGLSDEQVAQETRREQLLNQLNGYEEGLGNQYSERIEQIIQTEAETRKLIEAEQKREQMIRMIESNIESAFMSIVNGSKSVEDAFKSMLRNILLEIYQQQVAKPAASGIADLIGNFIGGFKGSVSIGRSNSAPASSLRPKARSFEGGGFTGYGPRSGGLDGRGGMLAMVHPNETVVDHTKGQKAGGNVTVVQNFSFQANGDESVKRIIGQSMPQIAQYTSKTIVDQRRKGGSMKAAFRG